MGRVRANVLIKVMWGGGVWANSPRSASCPGFHLLLHFLLWSLFRPSLSCCEDLCAAEVIFCCPTENSHHLKSWILSKDAKNYSRWENEPNQTSCKRPPPPPAKSNGVYFPRVFHVVIPDPPNTPAVATRHSGWQLLGERVRWSAVWYNSLTGW